MKEMKPRYAVPIGPYLDKSALLKMGYLDASSSLAMTSMTIAELWSREKASLRRGCPFRQKDLDPYFTVEEIRGSEAEPGEAPPRLGPRGKAGGI